MNNSELTNFSLHEPIELLKLATTLWINGHAIPDLKMNLVKSSLAEFAPDFVKEINESWKKLEARAKDNFPKNSPFVFYNSKVLNFEGLSENFVNEALINVSQGISYQTISATRSNQDLFNKVPRTNAPCAFVVVSILVTGDNKLVFGKRKYYGDWPYHTYETAGAFLKEEDLEKESLIKNAADKIREDFNNVREIKTIPFIIYHLPRILETILLCISKIPQKSSELTSDFYSDLLIVDNSVLGIEKILTMPLKEFHPPSRIVMQTYYENFDVAEKLLKELH